MSFAERKLVANDGERPAEPAQIHLADIWRELLGVDSVGLNDDFFDLGGHSLLTLRLIQQIEEATSRRITIADIFDRPTIRELAELFDGVTWDVRLSEELPHGAGFWASFKRLMSREKHGQATQRAKD